MVKEYFSKIPCPRSSVALNEVTSSFASLKNCNLISLSEIPVSAAKYCFTSDVSCSIPVWSKDASTSMRDFLILETFFSISSVTCGICALICSRICPILVMMSDHISSSKPVIFFGSTGSSLSISARYAFTAFTISRNCSVGSAVPEKISLYLSAIS